MSENRKIDSENKVSSKHKNELIKDARSAKIVDELELNSEELDAINGGIVEGGCIKLGK